MAIEGLHPALVFLIGAVLVAATRGKARQGVSLATPLIAALALLGLPDGSSFSFELMGQTLIFAHIGRPVIRAIDAGENLEVAIIGTRDIDGHARIVNGTIDIGAHEFGSTPVSVKPEQMEGDELTLHSFALYPSYPNPFNPRTSIRFRLPTAGHVKLVVYGIGGQEVATLIDEFRQAGTFEYNWPAVDARGKELVSGVYFVRLQSKPYDKTIRLLLLK